MKIHCGVVIGKYTSSVQRTLFTNSSWYLLSVGLDLMNAGMYAMWQQLAITEDQKYPSAIEWQCGDKTVQKFIHLRKDEAEI